MRQLAAILLILLLTMSAAAQPPGVCRVKLGASNVKSVGSGVLIDRVGQRGLVLTAAHVIDSAVGEVTFRDGEKARVIRASRDKDRNDVGLLIVEGVLPAPVVLAPTFVGRGRYRLYGYGPDGILRRYEGVVVGYGLPKGATYQSADIGVLVRSGDSGGPVFNSRGELVGVIWGCDRQSLTSATVGRPVLNFLARALTAVCEGGNCYRPSRPLGRALGLDPRFTVPIIVQPKQPPSPPAQNDALDDVNKRLEELAANIDAGACNCGNYAEQIAEINSVLARIDGVLRGYNTRLNELASKPDNTATIVAAEVTKQIATIKPETPDYDSVVDRKLRDRLDHPTPINVWSPDGQLLGSSQTNIFRQGAIDFTFQPKARVGQ